ncbi:hypothetical protein B0H14DRAFT_2578202 [Mycena olivaceomarginata]|nr:hypothetical protein B0H14DRAFT_2578202 [Mycena olivaceomarginata]
MSSSQNLKLVLLGVLCLLTVLLQERLAERVPADNGHVGGTASPMFYPPILPHDPAASPHCATAPSFPTPQNIFDHAGRQIDAIREDIHIHSNGVIIEATATMIPIRFKDPH